MAKRMIERYRRGPIGWIMRVLFWGFNALMAYAVIVGVAGNAEKSATITDEEMRTAFDAGTGLGVMMLFVFWAAGAVVFGSLSYFTRGRKEIIEVDE